MRARAAALALLVAIGPAAAIAQEPPAERPAQAESGVTAEPPEPSPQSVDGAEAPPADRPEPAPGDADGSETDALPIDGARPPERPETAEIAPEPSPDPAPEAAPDAPPAPAPSPDPSPDTVPAPSPAAGAADLSPLSLGGGLALPTAAPLALTQPGAATPAAPSVPETLRESDADYAACLGRLDRLGVGYAEIAPITDATERDCGIARPLQVETLRGDIALAGGAPMRCEAALALAQWTDSFVLPAARLLPDAPRLTGMQLGSTYDCRGRVGTGSETPKLSEHANGNAIDIMAFTFETGEPLVVSPRAETGDMAEAFQRAVRGSACLFFTTVLGPGSNAAHDDHLHLDIAARNGGWRLCE